LFTNISNKEYSIKLNQDNIEREVQKSIDKNISIQEIDARHAPLKIINFRDKPIEVSNSSIKESVIFKKDSIKY